MQRLFTICLLMVLVGGTLAAGVVVYHVGRLQAHDARSQWPTVQGIVRASGILEVGCIEDSRDTVSVTRQNHLMVEFAYEVDGVPYSDHQKWRIRGGTREEERVKGEYSPGTIVPVYYNSANHAEAVAAPRGWACEENDWVVIGRFIVYLIGLAGVLLALVGIMIFVGCFRD